MEPDEWSAVAVGTALLLSPSLSYTRGRGVVIVLWVEFINSAATEGSAYCKDDIRADRRVSLILTQYEGKMLTCCRSSTCVNVFQEGLEPSCKVVCLLQHLLHPVVVGAFEVMQVLADMGALPHLHKIDVASAKGLCECPR